ncbi:hypothetical protein Pcinc_015554 [Petrolisthes cinctipes]|uniref:Uncharacterized protein n=1 Tax=Petrolisthes cinctipes TaxID=88211 RepID=A0AAE1FU70_PETCI|nr:hypothetical protein Pcinc_015554 [Petrolisthes cinctipes]
MGCSNLAEDRGQDTTLENPENAELWNAIVQETGTFIVCCPLCSSILPSSTTVQASLVAVCSEVLGQ